ncbi:hypothetical protein [Ralstonia phage RP13]|nr:hypothetical protein [Ralstonia phage RP13]
MTLVRQVNEAWGRLMTTPLDIEEAIAISWQNNDRYTKYHKLLSQKYKLGPNKEFKIRGTEHYVMRYGPTNHKLLRGKYVYISLNFQDTNRAKYGYITHFAVSSHEYSSGFSKTATGYAVEGIQFKPIPKDFKKFEDVMNLIIGAGADFDHDRTKNTAALALGDDGEVQVDINKRFEIMAKLVRIVSMKTIPGMIIVGTGGLGKTYTVMKTLKDLGMLEGEHYIHVHGAKVTTTSFYAMLYENPDSLFIFDDSDSVLDDGDRINMLKSALDSGDGPRKVTYLSPSVTNMGMETSFEFKGQIIFISNRKMVDFDQPLISRSAAVDVSMTREEVFERMLGIIDKMPNGPDKELQLRAYNVIKKYDEKKPGRPKDLNMRTLLKIARVLSSSEGGDDVADYLLSVS